MEAQIASLIEMAQTMPLWLGLLALGLSSTIEYVFPPFPGDVILLTGALLIALSVLLNYVDRGAIGVAAPAAVLLNWLTTGDHLLHSLQQGRYAVAGMDLLLMLLALLALAAARRLNRRITNA